ncbi:hypothetical protein INT45_009128 [Circinella minor]|uniref:Uncharacterized protein n=1 Tax=Circinella minor TaxID=1195481 RepID=A0A8H7VQX8_9FUNG|nr:hypothetical protein INT45_009128 [Circinella minor]
MAEKRLMVITSVSGNYDYAKSIYGISFAKLRTQMLNLMESEGKDGLGTHSDEMLASLILIYNRVRDKTKFDIQCALYTYYILTTELSQQDNDRTPSPSSTIFELNEYFITVLDKIRTKFLFYTKRYRATAPVPATITREQKQKQKESPNASESVQWLLRSFEGRSSTVHVASLTSSGGCWLGLGSRAVESSSSVVSSSD